MQDTDLIMIMVMFIILSFIGIVVTIITIIISTIISVTISIVIVSVTIVIIIIIIVIIIIIIILIRRPRGYRESCRTQTCIDNISMDPLMQAFNYKDSSLYNYRYTTLNYNLYI